MILSLIRDRRIDGNLLGTSKENSIFYPKVYTDAQAKYIESFFNQNGYIEYSLVRNLGITDPEGQTKIVLKDRPKILFLTSGCVDLMTFLPQLEINIEQNLLATEFVDLTSLMPNSFDENDLERLIKSEASIKQLIETVGAEFLSNTFLLAKELKTKIETKLNEICRDFAEKVRQIETFFFSFNVFSFKGIRALYATTLRCSYSRNFIRCKSNGNDEKSRSTNKT